MRVLTACVRRSALLAVCLTSEAVAQVRDSTPAGPPFDQPAALVDPGDLHIGVLRLGNVLTTNAVRVVR